MRLDTAKWEPFRINKLFDIYTGGDLIMRDLDDGDIPIASNSAENNNIAAYTSLLPERKLFDHTKSISIADRGKFWAFIQPKDFYLATRVKALVCKEDCLLNSFQMAFIVSILNQESFKFSYGRNCCAHLPDVEIFLPVRRDVSGTAMQDNNCRFSENGYLPDWQFMEDYIKTLHYKPLTTKNKANDLPKLDVSDWKEFRIGSLFTMLNGKGITQDEIIDNEGTFIAVQSGEENNGVMGKIDLDYCKKMGYSYTEKPCLTVARSGSAGFVSYQNEGCVVGDSAKILLLVDEITSKEVYLFLQTVLNAHRFKYSYGRKVTEEKYLGEWIKLPIQHEYNGAETIDETHKYSEKGYVPDWKYMENYIRSLPFGDRLTVI